jgi:hypothetical protein
MKNLLCLLVSILLSNFAFAQTEVNNSNENDQWVMVVETNPEGLLSANGKSMKGEKTFYFDRETSFCVKKDVSNDYEFHATKKKGIYQGDFTLDVKAPSKGKLITFSVSDGIVTIYKNREDIEQEDPFTTW